MPDFRNDPMTGRVKNKRRDWRNEKPVGAFCGAFLGFILVMIPLLFIENPGIVIVVIVALGGIISGIIAGLRFPGIAHAVFWIFDIVFHFARIGP